MKFIYFTLFCLLPFGNIFAQYKSKLSTRSSVVFPSKPQELTKEGHVIYTSALDKESKVTGMATAIDVSQFGVDSSAIASNYDNTLFVDLILQTIVGQYDGMEIVSKKKVTIGRLLGYDLSFKNNNPPTKELPYRNVYARVLFAGSNVFALTVLDEAGANGGVYKDKFFSSLKVD